VGQLAAGVAHDFNNILTIIQGHISLLLDTRKVDPQLEKPLRHVLGASERASMLTRQLLAFSRKQMIQRRPINLHLLLDQHSQMLQRLIGEHIQLTFSCPSDLPAVFADACNIEQVIMNLAVNSRDAMPQGGQLVISAETIRIGPSYAEANPEATPGDFVCLSVRDTGCGIDETTRARLFEPFFTTKEVGKGTGMGLATVYGIIKQHNGWIEVESLQGRGTTFKVYLPVCADPTAMIEAERPAAPPKRSSPARRQSSWWRTNPSCANLWRPSCRITAIASSSPATPTRRCGCGMHIRARSIYC
jgi:signal transduction histidine kinase